jgi:two-component system OmpR family response regulator
MAETKLRGLRVLVVEDDTRMAGLLERGLLREGAVVRRAADGPSGLELAGSGRPDLVVLDAMRPGLEGFEVCRRLRAAGLDVPVLMLTARSEVEDRILGLEQGADDYLTKPFVFAELVARLQALSRRAGAPSEVLQVGDLMLDPATHMASRGEAGLDLTRREFELLELFMRHPGQVLSKDMLLEHVWPGAGPSSSNVAEVYVRYLREKIDRPFGRASLQTVRGLGYRLTADPAT